MENIKKCSKCGSLKDYALFSKNKSQKDGYCNQCKLCITSTNASNPNIKHRIERKIFKLEGVSVKECNKCILVCPIVDFDKRSHSKDGLTGECKQCISKRNKLYRALHRDELDTHNKIYRKENIGKIKAQKRQHYWDNRETIRLDTKVRHKNNPINSMFLSAKRRANKNNLPFLITKEYLLGIWPKDNKCPILGIELKVGNRKEKTDSPSLDRLIPEFGYVPGNVAIISNRVNFLKRDETDPSIFLSLYYWIIKSGNQPRTYLQLNPEACSDWLL